MRPANTGRCSEELVRLQDRIAVLEQDNSRLKQALSSASSRCELLEDSPLPFWIAVDNVLITANTAALRLLGANARSEVIGRSPLDFIHPAFHASMQRHRVEARTRRGTPPVRERVVRVDGSAIDVEAIRWVSSYEGREAVVSCFTEVDESGSAHGLPRAAETRVLEMIVERRPLSAILDTLARLTEEQIPGAICTILLSDEKMRVLTLGAAPSMPPAFHEASRVVPIGPEMGACGSAASLGRPVIVSDITTDPLFAAYREAAEAFQLRACWSTPIFSRAAKVLGTFALYFREPRSPLPQELAGLDTYLHLAEIAVGRRRAEDDLRLSEERRLMAIEATGLGTWYWDLERDEVGWDDRCMQLLDAPPGRNASYPAFLECVDARDRARVDDIVRSARQQGAGFDMEYRVVHRDKSICWLATIARVQRTTDGRAIRMHGTVMDVTARKRAEIDLQESETRYKLVARATNEAIWDWDLQSGRLIWTEAFGRLFGYSAEQFVTEVEWWVQRIHPDDRERIWGELTRAVGSGAEQWSGEYRFRLADGTYADILDRGYTVRDAAGRSVRMIGSMVDVTERKRAAGELARQARELAQSNEDLRRFAFAASHDLQEPLRMVVSYTQLLRKRYGDRLDEDAKQFMEYVVEGATRLEVLIRALREYWQTANSGDVVEGSADTNRAVEIAIQRLSRQHAAAGAVIRHDNLPAVRAPMEVLVQIFKEIFENAIKYHSDRPLTVDVTAQPVGDMWMLAVVDNGIGIDARYLQQVFGIFKRAHGRGYAGIGIGLAITRKMVERYGGKMWVESEPGKGSTFYFTLPRG